MLRYLLRRALQSVVVLVGAAILVFTLLHIVPGDPVRSAMGTRFDPEMSNLSATSATLRSVTSASASATARASSTW